MAISLGIYPIFQTNPDGEKAKNRLKSVGPQALEALGVTAPRSAGEEARDEGAWEINPPISMIFLHLVWGGCPAGHA